MRTMLLLPILLFFMCWSIEVKAQLELEFPVYAEGFNSPVSMAHAGDDRLFIVQRPGQISIIEGNGEVLPTNFINIQNRILSGGERGLLGLAFHPQYGENGYFYVNYTRSGDGATVISRFSVTTADPNIADPDSELILMTIAQPFHNHNGGAINFGPDGYLYIGMGDGGSGGDPQDNSQNPLTLLGKMLRIDVDNGDPYSIPEDNPFFGDDFHLDEIWALGLRNPWVFSFDTENGDMWIADVGQNAWEEINHQLGGIAGGQNYGWRCYEGFEPFNLNGCQDISNYTMPVAVYGRSGGCSVSGGEVYRGAAIPDLVGKYIYTDYCDDNIWTITIDENGDYINELITTSGLNNATGIFAGADNELYIIVINGFVHKITASSCNFVVSISSDELEICEGESIEITVSTDINEPSTQLFLDGENVGEGGLSFDVTQAGEYFVRVESEGCVIDSETITITERELSDAEFLEIPATIPENEAPFTLIPNVEGGVFEGPGVDGNEFDPALAGVGEHTITYTITEEDRCEASTSQTIEVLMATSSQGVNSSDFSVRLKPNPVVGSILQIDLVSPRTEILAIEVMDMNGKTIQRFPSITLPSGNSVQTFEFEIGAIPEGMYMLKLSNKNHLHTERFIRR